MFGIILVSHGEFAKAALGSAEMIAGKQEQVIAIALSEDKSLDDLEKEIMIAYETLSNECDYVVALCDIFGGSPFNAISRCQLKGVDLTAYTGLSLPVLIDILFARDLNKDELDVRVRDTSSKALQKIETVLHEDENDIDL